jgi:NADH dehydrogenase
VREDLTLVDHPEVYVIGDGALFRPSPETPPLPPNAPVAIQEARCVAENVWRRWQGLPPRAFRYYEMGELVSLGRHTAVADVFGLKLTGYPAWLVWRGYYLSQLHGFKNRLGVALDWSFAYFWRRDTARIELADGGEARRTGHEAAVAAHR